MHLSMTLPTMLPHTREHLVAWCRGIDAGPWASLAVPERTTFTSHDLVVQLSAAAVLTERVRLWTTIVILPAHDAVDTAKKMASVDVLSNGRLTMGIGVGGREHDYRALGASYDRRWQRMDDQVTTMRNIWSGEPPFEGADPVGPTPVQAGGPPLIAGALGPKAIARAAVWAHGVDGAWTLDGATKPVRDAFDTIEQAWTAVGRHERPHLSTSIWCAVGPNAEAQLRTYAYNYLKIFGEAVGEYGAQGVAAYTPDALRRAIAGIRSAGADELFLVPTSADPAELERLSEVVATEI